MTGLVLIGVAFASIMMTLSSDAIAAQAARAKGAPPVIVTSDKMDADMAQNVVRFKGNVTAVEEFTLCADELSLRYSAAKEVESIQADGSVRIFQEQRLFRSDSAVYDRAARTVTLIGRAEVEQCGDVVKGDRIVANLDDRNAMVESQGGKRVNAVITPGKECAQTKTGAPGLRGASKGRGNEALCKGAR